MGGRDGRRRGFTVSLSLAALLVTAPSLAAPTCDILNATPLAFGPYTSGQAAPVDSIGEIDVQCTGTLAVRISLGRGASGHQAPRAMSERGASLAYNIFLDATHTTIWGDGADGTQSFTGTAQAGQPLRLPMFGRIFGLQGVPRGRYTDRIVVVVTF